jgi:DUF1009 family protein
MNESSAARKSINDALKSEGSVPAHQKQSATGSAAPSPKGGAGPLALICGGGGLPFAVADAVMRRGGSVVLFPLIGWADAARVENYPHQWIAIAQVGHFVRAARAAGCRNVVLIGSVLRTPFLRLRIDMFTLRLLPRIRALFRGGDDHLLSGVAMMLEELGFCVLGAHDVAPEILVPDGVLGSIQPTAQARKDAELGLHAVESLGALDIGQAVVVVDGRIVAVEAVEGTEQMLLRIAELRAAGRLHIARGNGVVVKAAKPQQDWRVDLPALGVSTIQQIRNAGLAGIAVRAFAAITSDRSALVRAADAAGVFVLGVRQAAGTQH